MWNLDKFFAHKHKQHISTQSNPPPRIWKLQCCSMHNLDFITRRTRRHILLVIDINWYKRYQFCYSKQHYKHYSSACMFIACTFWRRVWSSFWTCILTCGVCVFCSPYIWIVHVQANTWTYDGIDKPIKTILQRFTRLIYSSNST